MIRSLKLMFIWQIPDAKARFQRPLPVSLASRSRVLLSFLRLRYRERTGSAATLEADAMMWCGPEAWAGFRIVLDEEEKRGVYYGAPPAAPELRVVVIGPIVPSLKLQDVDKRAFGAGAFRSGPQQSVVGR